MPTASTEGGASHQTFAKRDRAAFQFALTLQVPGCLAASGYRSRSANTSSGKTMHLHIANKLYSSWSLRPWILMTALDIPFTETVIPMYFPDSRARMLDISPTGKMPCLIDGDVKVWESLAIMEYLAERLPGKGVWPKEAAARAHARAISSEMHAGFQALRNACPMNLAKRFQPRDDLG